jgi:hypothetical protein
MRQDLNIVINDAAVGDREVLIELLRLLALTNGGTLRVVVEGSCRSIWYVERPQQLLSRFINQKGA